VKRRFEMPKKFVVSIAFPVDSHEGGFESAEKLKFFIEENGYLFVEGESEETDDHAPIDLTVFGNEMSVIVTEINC
jgi:hypothetical protein